MVGNHRKDKTEKDKAIGLFKTESENGSWISENVFAKKCIPAKKRPKNAQKILASENPA